jgi:hypothetical protein
MWLGLNFSRSNQTPPSSDAVSRQVTYFEPFPGADPQGGPGGPWHTLSQAHQGPPPGHPSWPTRRPFQVFNFSSSSHDRFRFLFVAGCSWRWAGGWLAACLVLSPAPRFNESRQVLPSRQRKLPPLPLPYHAARCQGLYPLNDWCKVEVRCSLATACLVISVRQWYAVCYVRLSDPANFPHIWFALVLSLHDGVQIHRWVVL